MGGFKCFSVKFKKLLVELKFSQKVTYLLSERPIVSFFSWVASGNKKKFKTKNEKKNAKEILI